MRQSRERITNVSNLLDPLLLPQRLTSRVLEDLRRLADAAVSVGALAGEVRGRLPRATEWADEVKQILDSARAQLAGVRASLEPMSDDLDALRGAFAATNDQIERLREAAVPELAGLRMAVRGVHEEVGLQRELIGQLTTQIEQMGELLGREISTLRETLRPLVRDAEEIRDVVEPLESATERLGRFAERLPGPGRKRTGGLLSKPEDPET
jgi:chromosome segregation ATPase